MTNEVINEKRREFLGASALALASAIIGVPVMTNATAIAADYKKNPFGLVYNGAITKNEPGKVNIHPVKYKLHGLDIVANVYTPANYYPSVDVARLGLLGICGGGGYSLSAAKADKRFKSIATLSMFNSGRVRRNGFADSQLDSIEERLRQVTAARAQEMAGGEILYAGDANLTDAQIAALPFEMYRQGYEYYWKTHAHPNSTFKYTMSSLLDLMRWDATDQIELIDQPLLMIAGSKADSLYMTEDAFPKATGTKDKELFKIEGATHIETYWVPKYVEAAMSKLTPFFGRTLVS